jgi:hypothetical protein
MPLLGEFVFDADRIVFKGGERPAATPLPASDGPAEEAEPPRTIKNVGLAVCDRSMVTGRLEARITFTGAITPSTVCELVFAYNVLTKSHLGAGLGGGGSLFSIRAWTTSTPQQGASGGATWLNIIREGDRANLKVDVPYHLTVGMRGAEILLEVDGVQVAKTTLPGSLTETRQVGLFCLGEHDIVVTNFNARIDRPKAFIVMQFSSPYDELYSHVIKTACDELEVDAIRADEIYGPGIIIKDVIDRISESQLVIADISPTNPNVFFEVGYALAKGKPIILLAKRPAPGERLPFDLSAFRVLFYDDSIGGKPKLEEGLRQHIRKILGSPTP